MKMSAPLLNSHSSSNKLHLIPFTEQHFSILIGWFFSEKDIVQWGGPDLSYPLNEEHVNSMLSKTKTIPSDSFCWMAEDDAGELCGHCQLVFDWRNGIAKICRVVISPQHRGRGFSLPMVSMVLEKAFSYAEIERVELNVYAWNEIAIKTYSRVGFIGEGVRRSSVKVGDERWDTAIMSMLRDEWVASSVSVIK
ncbi:GNAT family N-acetyltransferase [Symbiopectobacterium purcellii]|uniref:GNAT family N-acetyltransferase n=2 Tax=Symbiopectobacterium purcellii TaxID=2871826 RepID=A0ABX9AXG6_9ENTR|nr:GNAT family N-acetyltransferase [Symbiopectobacterium purcellii]